MFGRLSLQVAVNRHIQVIYAPAVVATEMIVRIGIPIKVIRCAAGKFSDQALVVEQGEIAVYRPKANGGQLLA